MKWFASTKWCAAAVTSAVLLVVAGAARAELERYAEGAETSSPIERALFAEAVAVKPGAMLVIAGAARAKLERYSEDAEASSPIEGALFAEDMAHNISTKEVQLEVVR